MPIASRMMGVALALSALAGTGTVQAQAPEASQHLPTTDDVEVARVAYQRGARAAAEGKWEEARLAFLAAWRVQRNAQIAANLGRAELKLGRYRDAAEHLAYAMRDASVGTEENKQLLREMLAEAQVKVGAVALRVEPAGAAVWVDGNEVGIAPLEGDVFVEPGKRVAIEARLAGHEAGRREVEVAAGETETVTLWLEPEQTGGRPNPARAPAPAPTPVGAREVWIGVGSGATLVAVGTETVLLALGFAKDDRIAELEALGPAATPDQRREWRDLQDERATLLSAGIACFIGASAIGTATLVYALTSSKDTAAPKRTGVVVYPMHGGMGVVGTF